MHLLSIMIFLLFVIAPAFVNAQPAITSCSGSLEEGQTIVIQGGGFGLKAEPAPLKWDNFESGEAGSELTGWNFDTGGGVLHPRFSSGYTRPGSAVSAVCPFIDEQYLSTFGVYRPAGLTRVYMDFWVLFDRPDPVSRNHKLYRLYPSLDSGLPNQYFQIYCNENSSTGHFTNDGVTGDAWGDTRAYPGWVNDSAEANWVHMQFYLEQSDAGVTNGILQAWFDCGHSIDRNDYLSRDAENNGDWQSVWFGNYSSHGSDDYCSSSGDAFIYFDDVYVDITRSRVEIGDQANYSLCTHREIQVPQAWESGEISFVANPGSFPQDSPVYLFVTDTDGRVSPGFGPVPIGTNISYEAEPGMPGKPVLRD